MYVGCLEVVWRVLESVRRVSRECQDGVWKVFGVCLEEAVWRVSVGCFVCVWRLSGGCLDGVWKVSGGCLESVCFIKLLSIIHIIATIQQLFCISPVTLF